MLTRCLLALSLIAVAGAVGCDNSQGTSGTGGGPTGYSLTLDGTLKADNGKVGFLSPAASVTQVDVADIVGKPYLVATFPAGFSPGNDPAIDSTWGTVPEDLHISYTTPATYKDGAYDVVLLIYRATDITPAIKAQPASAAPAAKNGDLATFTMDMSVVRPGDPAIPAGLLRVNVAGKSAEVSAENHIITDFTNADQLKAAFVNTIMIVP
jgi:hypothetical protein